MGLFQRRNITDVRYSCPNSATLLGADTFVTVFRRATMRKAKAVCCRPPVADCLAPLAIRLSRIRRGVLIAASCARLE
jgi:hypothetical protein